MGHFDTSKLKLHENVSQMVANVRQIVYTMGEVMNMAKTANINVRTEPSVKANAEELFATFGMTVTEAINIFLHQSLLVGGLPFEVRQPKYNAETLAAMQEARDIASGKIKTKSYSSVKELFDELDSEDDDAET